MNDEALKALRDQRDEAMTQRTALKRRLEDILSQMKRLNNEVQALNRQRTDLSEPYKVVTERVADLTSQIEAEERRRQEQAAMEQAAAKAAAATAVASGGAGGS